MNDRIREVRKDAGLSMRAFGDRLGISSAAVSKIETGINTPSEQTIRAICSEFHVNRAWLEDGVGNMRPVSSFPAHLLTVLEKYPTLRIMLEKIDEELGADGWAALNQVIEQAIESKYKKESQ